MKTFDQHYAQLNPAQKQAVDTIEGPVMVVAGPGTGKTQLLSMRVANILRQTDILPNNILCLTFTESAATAMRQRLVGLIGTDGHKVAIHTFHSFGTEIINHYPEYFYQGANFRPADELTSFEVLNPIFEDLRHDNPLASSMNGQFTALRDTLSAIGYLKKAGLTSDELLKIIDHNEEFIAYAEPIVVQAFDVPRLAKKDIAMCQQALHELQKFEVGPPPLSTFRPLADLCIHEFEHAVGQAAEQGSTKPLTAWRSRWLERNPAKQYVFKDRKRLAKLRALADIYHKYLLSMQKNELFDFDDMILRVSHALEYFADLRYNLQEQYQYVLVDEFQDTNGAQLRLLQNLLTSQVSDGRPNIMVVGDDDQAIYAFQGAEVGNIVQFRDLYRDPVVITLTENYRSTDTILQSARHIIVQGEYRLETTLEKINKTLHANNQHQPTTSELHQFATMGEQYAWLADHIDDLVKNGHPADKIAVIARNHKQLQELLPYLRQAGLSVNYERRNNVLEAEHIQALVTLARTVVALAGQRFDIADALLPRLLSYAFWGLDTKDMWRLSLNAYKDHRFWLELMLEETGKLRAIAELLVVSSHLAQTEPLEHMLDLLLGSNEKQVADTDDAEVDTLNHDGPPEGFVSPLRAYYFNAVRLDTSPTEYLTMLSNLAVIRRRLRDYRPDQSLLLRDFVEFVDVHEKTNTPIVDTGQHHDNSHAINLMTAHKAKGLEFDTVFVASCQEDIWGPSARARQNSIRFPYNLPIEPAGQTNDDCLRLFFVAMTRARHNLFLSYYQTDASGKDSLPASFLPLETLPVIDHPAGQYMAVVARTLQPNWQTRHLQLTNANKHELLQPRLETYQLSSTHLNNFVDVTAGGPQAFFLQNLLRFPQAMHRDAIFGSIIHTVLQRAHVHLVHTGERRPTEDILHDFELHLQNARLNERDFTYLLEKGSEILQTFIARRHHSFTQTQKVEYSLRGVPLGDVRLVGTIDLLEVDNQHKTITVTDYKTGRPPASWHGATDTEKIKLHKYRQQLMMYKLLIEHSPDFVRSHTVQRGVLEFVQPDADNQITLLDMAFDDSELQEFTKLLQAVWRCIMSLELPDTAAYPPNYKGILQFEQDLRERQLP